MKPRSKVVVIPWSAGEYSFRTWWEAALFRWLMPRWSAWVHWDYLSPAQQATALKPGRRRPKRLVRKYLKSLWDAWK